MADPTLAQRLAEAAVAARDGDLPRDVRASVHQRVLDILGICVAASPLETSQAARHHVVEQGGAAHATGIGVADRLPAPQAAFLNGVLAHSLDYDDTHLPSILHPSASVVPAALAVAEQVSASGSQLTAAIAAGLEVCVRVGMAGYVREAGNSLFFERGQHATSICGALGSATAAALLHGADAEGVLHAIGVSASMASGLIEANRTGGTVKRIHCGWAAQAGVTAAQLVRRGLTGPPTVLEGRFGFFQAFLAGEFDTDEITDGLGTEWAAPTIHFKPYPANHFTHTGIDAARRLRQRGIAPDDIDRLELAVAAPTVRTIGQPIDVKRTPDTGYQAQFSGPYTVVSALLGGGGLGLGLDDFTDELAQDPRRRELMAKVDVVGADDLAEIYPSEFPARLTARLTDGSEVVEEVLANRGGPADPLSDAELATKFRDNASRGLGEGSVDELSDTVLGLDHHADVRDLLLPLRALRNGAGSHIPR